jgi:hypothetical protein
MQGDQVGPSDAPEARHNGKNARLREHAKAHLDGAKHVASPKCCAPIVARGN